MKYQRAVPPLKQKRYVDVEVAGNKALVFWSEMRTG